MKDPTTLSLEELFALSSGEAGKLFLFPPLSEMGEGPVFESLKRFYGRGRIYAALATLFKGAIAGDQLCFLFSETTVDEYRAEDSDTKFPSALGGEFKTLSSIATNPKHPYLRCLRESSKKGAKGPKVAGVFEIAHKETRDLVISRCGLEHVERQREAVLSAYDKKIGLQLCPALSSPCVRPYVPAVSGPNVPVPVPVNVSVLEKQSASDFDSFQLNQKTNEERKGSIPRGLTRRQPTREEITELERDARCPDFIATFGSYEAAREYLINAWGA